MRISNTRTRRGFTLVEVLVAAGLSMLIMLMITTAFQKGMDTLSQLKSVGELQQRLRAVETVMTGDLQAEHFESRYGPKVSDQRPDKLQGVTLDEQAPWRPPTRGFFRLSTPNVIFEGTDAPANGNISTRAVDHTLAMTVRRNPNRGDKMFSAQMPTNMPAAAVNSMNAMCLSQMTIPNSNTMASDWAEVVYFLDTANPVGQTKGGTPLFGLYRRVRVLPGSGTPATSSVYPGTGTNPITTAGDTQRDLCQGISMVPNLMKPERNLNSPESIRNPRNRLGGMFGDRVTGTAPLVMNHQWDLITREQNSTTGLPTGSDLLLSDVLSFEIKADWDVPAGTPLTSPMMPANSMANGYEFPFNILPAAPNRNALMGASRVFDTWYDTPGTGTNNDWLAAPTTPGGTTNDVIPQPIRLRAVQIKVRVWDRKNNIARQITIIQDL